MLADLQSVEGMLQKAQRTARTGDKDAKVRVEMLTACEARLAAGKPVRGLDVRRRRSRRRFSASCN